MIRLFIVLGVLFFSNHCLASDSTLCDRFTEEDIDTAKKSEIITSELKTFEPFFAARKKLNEEKGSQNVTRKEIGDLLQEVDLNTLYSPVKVPGSKAIWYANKQLTHETNKENLDLMKQGKAPYTPNGNNKYNAHHVTQNDEDDIVTLTGFTHKGGHGLFHKNNSPTKVNRSTFATKRKHFYQAVAERAEESQPPKKTRLLKDIR